MMNVQKDKRLAIFGILFSTRGIGTFQSHRDVERLTCSSDDANAAGMSILSFNISIVVYAKNTSKQRFENVLMSVTRIWNIKMQFPFENIIVISQIPRCFPRSSRGKINIDMIRVPLRIAQHLFQTFFRIIHSFRPLSKVH